MIIIEDVRNYVSELGYERELADSIRPYGYWSEYTKPEMKQIVDEWIAESRKDDDSMLEETDLERVYQQCTQPKQ